MDKDLEQSKSARPDPDLDLDTKTYPNPLVVLCVLIVIIVLLVVVVYVASSLLDSDAFDFDVLADGSKYVLYKGSIAISARCAHCALEVAFSSIGDGNVPLRRIAVTDDHVIYGLKKGHGNAQT